MSSDPPPGESHGPKTAACLEALSRVNDCFAVFTDHAGSGAARQEMWRFYRRMPIYSGPPDLTFSRTEVWREYVALLAERAGDRVGAAALRRCTDEDIVDYAARLGFQV